MANDAPSPISDDEDWWINSSQTLAEQIGSQNSTNSSPVSPAPSFHQKFLQRLPSLSVAPKHQYTVPNCAPGIDYEHVRHCQSFEMVEVLFPDSNLLNSQISIADELIKVYIAKKHIIIESPAGSGESVSYLCASLAYQRRCYSNQDSAPPRIVIACADSDRLRSLSGQLRRTPYRPRAITLTDKSELCSNSDVASGCKHYDNLDHEIVLDALQARCHGPDPSFDIEVLKQLEQTYNVCPLFISQVLSMTSHITFLPFSILFENFFCKNSMHLLDESLLIIDGSSKLVDLAKDQLSSTIYIGELKSVIDSCDLHHNVHGSNEQCFIIRVVASQLRSLIINCSKNAASSQNAELMGNTLQVNTQIFRNSLDQIRCEKVLSILMNSAESRVFLPFETVPFKKFCGLMQSIFLLLNRATSFFATIHNEGNDLLLSVKCIHPGVLLEKLFDKTRSSVLISQSLSPVDLFLAELGMPVIERVNRVLHIPPEIELDAMFRFGVLGRANAGTEQLNGRHEYLRRNISTYAENVGSILVKITETIQHGIIVLVPSFYLLENLFANWSHHSILTKMQKNHRQVLFDSKEHNENDFHLTLMDNFCRSSKKHSGAILFTTYHSCFGIKPSFSTDSRYHICVCLGIPFSAQDPVINASFDHLNNTMTRSDSDTTYREMAAMRVVITAISHLFDIKKKFAILLLDHRYNSRAVKCFPKWMLQRRILCNDIDYFVHEMGKFLDSDTSENPANPSNIENSAELAEYPSDETPATPSINENPAELAEYRAYILKLCQNKLESTIAIEPRVLRSAHLPVPDDLDRPGSSSPDYRPRSRRHQRFGSRSYHKHRNRQYRHRFDNRSNHRHWHRQNRRYNE